MDDHPKNKDSASAYLEVTRECSTCGAIETIELKEEIVAPGDKVYPSGSVLCASCRTPTMVTVYRWTKWKHAE